MKAGNTVKWIAPTAYVGPARMHIVAVSHGELRKVFHVSKDGKQLWLEGRDGKGFYGHTASSNVELVTSS